MLRRLAYLSIGIISLWASPALLAQVDWPLPKLTSVVEVGASVTGFTHAGDGSGRLFIVEQAGRLRIVKNGALLPTPFLDITDRVLTGGERGALGAVFPPGFAGKGYFYAAYTAKPNGAVVLSRFSISANPDIANSASEQILLSVSKPYDNHNGGQLAFGLDGCLYIGLGDGGDGGDPGNRAQNPQELLGKVLRLDVESGASPYGIPPGNPFVGNAAYKPEIWALGLRNPWRFSFDRLTGDLYIADVGQSSREEVNFQPASSSGGENYGWRVMEGSLDHNVPAGFDKSTLTLPVTDYSTAAGRSIIGGYVYRGPSVARMDGVYFYGDYMSARLFGLKHDGSVWQTNRFALSLSGISTFGEDEQGRLYVGTTGGSISLIEDTGQVHPPVIVPSGSVLNDNFIEFSSVSPGVTFRYTTDGTDPDETDPQVAPGVKVAAAVGMTFKVRAYREDLLPSSIVTQTFSSARVATPVLFPSAGPITNGTKITITSATPGATIRYNINGGVAPTVNSPLYTGPVAINGGDSLRAIAFRDDLPTSTSAGSAYAWAVVPTPTFSPTGPILHGTVISMANALEHTTIRYTLDGTTPTEESPVYVAPFAIQGGTVVKALAFRAGYKPSAVRSLTYQLVAVVTPSISPASTYLPQPTSVTITTTTPDAGIRYTTNGTDPTESSPLYTAPFTIEGATMVKARAFRADLAPSGIRSEFYEKREWERTVVSTFAGSGNLGSANGNGTAAEFRYPHGICVDHAGNLYVADMENHLIRKITPAGDVSLFAGTGVAGGGDGVRGTAAFNRPVGICVDANGMFYVTDIENQRLCSLDANGTVTTLGAGFFQPRFVEVSDSGTPYFTMHRVVVKFPTASYGDLNEHFGGASGLALRYDGTVFVSMAEASVKTVSPAGEIALYAGGNAGFSDGPRLLARFAVAEAPRDSAFDRLGNLYVCDYTRIRKIRPNGMVTTLAGGTDAGYQDGAGIQAQFRDALGICIDGNGVLYVTEAGNHRIRKIVQYDWDDDGIPDAAEGGASPYVLGTDESQLDFDGDGTTDAREFVAGTNPQDPSSIFAIRSLASEVDGKMKINWPTVIGRTYQVQYSEDMVTWTNAGPEFVAANTAGNFTDTSAAPVTNRRFYRIIVRSP